jgi:hypothetical protein
MSLNAPATSILSFPRLRCLSEYATVNFSAARDDATAAMKGQERSCPRLLDVIYDRALPAAALMSLTLGLLLLLRTGVRSLQPPAERAPRRRRLPQFGRKGLLISASSILFTFSCLYRALNVADEGAYLCRSRSTPFNAPAAGRFIATVGELALVFQLTVYLADTSARLGVRRSGFSSNCLYTMVPAVLAESCSWAGVLSSTAAFFCAEYVTWVCIGAMWAWDAAECLHHSARRGDTLTHGAIVVASLSLILFNLCHELPHFWDAQPLAPPPAQGGSRAWACTEDHDSAIWLERLPFFVCYFFGASWCSTAVASRYFLRGRTPTRTTQKPKAV